LGIPGFTPFYPPEHPKKVSKKVSKIFVVFCSPEYAETLYCIAFCKVEEEKDLEKFEVSIFQKSEQKVSKT
jgi:GH43 family beta-xylosidase